MTQIGCCFAVKTYNVRHRQTRNGHSDASFSTEPLCNHICCPLLLPDASTTRSDFRRRFFIQRRTGGIPPHLGHGHRHEPMILSWSSRSCLTVCRAVLVIRRQTGFSKLPSWKPGAGSKLIYLRKIVRNLTNRGWTGFDLELRQILDKPSRFDDGLSFNQVTRKETDVTSDRFERHYRRFEPRDSIRFEQGHVDNGAQLTLRLPISDTYPGRQVLSSFRNRYFFRWHHSARMISPRRFPTRDRSGEFASLRQEMPVRPEFPAKVDCRQALLPVIALDNLPGNVARRLHRRPKQRRTSRSWRSSNMSKSAWWT